MHDYYITISEEVEGFRWNARTNAFYAIGDIEMAVHLNSAKVVINDKLVLKSEYDAKIAALEANSLSKDSLIKYGLFGWTKDETINVKLDIINQAVYQLTYNLRTNICLRSEYLIIFKDINETVHYIYMNFFTKSFIIDDSKMIGDLADNIEIQNEYTLMIPLKYFNTTSDLFVNNEIYRKSCIAESFYNKVKSLLNSV